MRLSLSLSLVRKFSLFSCVNASKICFCPARPHFGRAAMVCRAVLSWLASRWSQKGVITCGLVFSILQVGLPTRPHPFFHVLQPRLLAIRCPQRGPSLPVRAGRVAGLTSPARACPEPHRSSDAVPRLFYNLVPRGRRGGPRWMSHTKGTAAAHHRHRLL